MGLVFSGISLSDYTKFIIKYGTWQLCVKFKICIQLWDALNQILKLTLSMYITTLVFLGSRQTFWQIYN